MSYKVPENSGFAPMAEADKLCELLFSLLKKRKQLTEKLLALAEELENVHKNSSTSRVVGSVAAICAAAFGTILTGDLATPLLVATTVGAIASPTLDVASTAREARISRNTMEETKNLMREDEKIGKDIQELIEDLKKRCVHLDRAHGSTDVGCEVATQIMGALAKQNNIDVPLDLLRSFIGSTFSQPLGELNAAGAVSQSVIVAAVTFLSLRLGLEVGAKGLGKSIAFTGVEAATTTAGFKSLGAIGFDISLYGLISSCEQMVKSNQGTEASQILRDAAREMQEASGKLKEQLDAMKEITQKMLELKDCIKSIDKYSLNLTETGQRIINYIIQSWTGSNVVSWLQTLPHQTEFINLLYYFEERLQDLPDRMRRNRGGHIDIVIVAHGEITDMLMPSALLMPALNIIDTVLYSPWNCLIDSFAACAIAEGWNNPDGREFYNGQRPVQFEPNPLPFHWNHMRRSLHNVPVILLTPVYPEEPVWQHFQDLQGHMDTDGRVIIPYVVPVNCVAAFGKMPFYMFIIALSYILMINEKTATVHLAACLGRRNSAPMPQHWLPQYAYTNDGTGMTNLIRAFRNLSLLEAFSSMFDRNDQE